METRKELLRQIEVIDDSILKLKEDEQASDHKVESNYLITEENMKLIDEISDLRKYCHKYLTQYNNLKRTSK